MSPEEILAVFDGSESLQHILDYRDGFFFPAGRDDLVAERRRREARSLGFMDRQRRLLPNFPLPSLPAPASTSALVSRGDPAPFPRDREPLAARSAAG